MKTAFKKYLFTGIIYPEPAVAMIRPCYLVDLTVFMARRDPDIDPGVSFPVYCPRRFSVNLSAQVLSVNIWKEKVVGYADSVLPRAAHFKRPELGEKRFVCYGQVGIHPDGNPRNLIKTAMVLFPVLLEPEVSQELLMHPCRYCKQMHPQ